MRSLFLAAAVLTVSLYAAPPPLPAHPTMRAGLGGGAQEKVGALTTAEYRFAAHDLLDPSGTAPDYLTEHVAVELGKLRARYSFRPGDFRFEELTIVRIVTVPPVNTDAQQASWKIRVGLETVRDRSCDHCVASILETGLGAGYQPFTNVPIFGYLLLDLELAFAPAFEHFFKPAMGPELGIRFYAGHELAMILRAAYRYQLFTSFHDAYEAGVEARWMLARTWAIDVKGTRFPDGWEGTAGVYYYF